MKTIACIFMACLAVCLAATSFRLAAMPIPLVVPPGVFFISCAARLQNDWRDRRHDLNKGKRFAFRHPRLFLSVVVAVWIICGLLIALAARESGRLAGLLATMAAAGLIYSEVRRVPWAPLMISAATSASPAMLPTALPRGGDRAWLLFAAAGLLIAGREILKDIEDSGFDAGYKWTVPVIYGSRAGRVLALTSVVGACFAVGAISPLAAIAFPPVGLGMTRLMNGRDPALTMAYLDAGAVGVVCILGLFCVP